MMTGPMVAFLALSDEIGGVTAEKGAKVKEAFEVIAELNAMATVCKKPDAGELAKVFAPLNSGIKGVTGIKKPKDRKDPANLFCDAVDGGIGSLGFVAATEKSWEVVQQNIDMFRFVGDKILMNYRKSGPESYVKWQASYQALLDALKAFAKEYHGNGLAWQPAHAGKSVTDYTPGEVATSGAAPSGGAAPAAATHRAGSSSKQKLDRGRWSG
jgi:hypothetical protein